MPKFENVITLSWLTGDNSLKDLRSLDITLLFWLNGFGFIHKWKRPKHFFRYAVWAVIIASLM